MSIGDESTISLLSATFSFFASVEKFWAIFIVFLALSFITSLGILTRTRLEPAVSL